MIHRNPCWHGWIYDNKLQVLSYPEQECSNLSIRDLPQPYRFYMPDYFLCCLQKHWMTDEIYAGLANACEVFVGTGMRELGFKIQRDYRASRQLRID